MTRAFLLLLVLLTACSLTRIDDESASVSFSLEGEIAPGEEKTICRYVRMPAAMGDDAQVFVRGGKHKLSEGGHHYLLYRTTKSEWTPDLDQTVPCGEHEGVLGNVTNYVTGGQTPEADADFPMAAALEFRPNEILLLQGHFLNASRVPEHVKIDLTLRTMRQKDVSHRAGVLRFYDPFITLPPRSKANATMTCTIKKDVTLISASAHMHARGVGYAAYIDPPDGPPSKTPFYTTKDGMHPTFYTGFLPLRAGSKVRFVCEYANDEDRLVTQGPSASNDEMCMFNAFYFPAMTAEDEACEDMHGHGTGGATCAATSGCLEQCPVEERPHFERNDPTVGPCWQRCITSSCPNVTGKLFPQLTCTAEKCESECAAMGEPCRACVRERCASELDACQSLACGPQ